MTAHFPARFLLGFLLLFSAPIFGEVEQRDKDKEAVNNSHFVLQEGLNCFCNTDYGCAKEKFSEYMKLEPDDSVGNWRAALNYYVWLRHEQKVDDPKLVDETSYKEILKLIQDGHEKAEVQKKKSKEVAFYLSVQASLSSLRALLEHGNGESGVARASFKKSVDEAVEADKLGSLYATYLLGLMHYRIGKRATLERWGLDVLAGIRFQTYKGIEMIFSVPLRMHSDFVCDVWGFIFQIVAEEDRSDIKKYLTPAMNKGLREFVVKYPNNEDVKKYSLVQQTSKPKQKP